MNSDDEEMMQRMYEAERNDEKMIDFLILETVSVFAAVGLVIWLLMVFA